MLAALDEAVGQIVEAIEKKGIRKNTLFFFSSDNGGPSPGSVTSNGPLRALEGDALRRGRARARVRDLGRPHQAGLGRRRRVAHGRLVSDLIEARGAQTRTAPAARRPRRLVDDHDRRALSA